MGAQAPVPIELTLARGVVAFRLLATGWMATLVVTNLISEPQTSRPIAVGAVAVAVGWSAVTVWAGMEPRRLSQPGFLVVDAIVAVLVGLAPALSDSATPFFGGYPMSWLVVMAFAHGLTGSFIAAAVLSVIIGAPQLIGMGFEAGATIEIGSIIVFPVVAAVVGWGFATLRASERRRAATQEELENERRSRIQAEERSFLAEQLQKSFVDTLRLMVHRADDPQEVRVLARAQEEELRQIIRDIQTKPSSDKEV